MNKNIQDNSIFGQREDFDHLHRCYQLLRLNLNFWELADVVAHTAIVTKVHLVNHCDDYAGAEEDDDFLEEKDKSGDEYHYTLQAFSMYNCWFVTKIFLCLLYGEHYLEP